MAILALVEELESQLTSTDDSSREEGTVKLAEAVEDPANESISSDERSNLLAFFIDKFTDQACIGGALRGCTALLSTSASAIKSKPSQEIVLASAIKLFREVPIASLGQDNRCRCLKLLMILIQEYHSGLMTSGLSLIDSVLQSVDGERDPRCLLVAFQLIQQVVIVYDGSVKLEEKAEDICDVVACYFPITFRLKPEDMHGITRDELASALEATFSCSPVFAVYIIPLLLEKLSSSIWQAKIDSLRGLAVCIEAWGWQGVAAHSGRIWWALRDELVDPLEPSVDEFGSSTAVAAADCLRRCLLAETQLQSKIPDLQTRQPVQSLLDKVMEDDHVTDLSQWLLESSGAGESETTLKRVAAAGTILTAACSASRKSCARLFQKLFGTLTKLGVYEDAVPASLAMSCILSMLKGVAQGIPDWAKETENMEAARMLEVYISNFLDSVLNIPLPNASAESPPEVKAALLRIRALAQLSPFRGTDFQLLSDDQLSRIVSSLLAVVLHSEALASVATEAALALAHITADWHEETYVSSTVPKLVETSSQLPQSSSDASSPALLCLVTMAQQAPALTPMILSQLTTAALSGIKSDYQSSASHIFQLNAISFEILSTSHEPFGDDEATFAVNLSLGLLEEALNWSEADTPDDLVLAAANAVRVCTSRCSSQNQEPIAAAIGKQLTGSGKPRDSLVTIACSAAIALRPGVLIIKPPNNSLDILRILLTTSLETDGSTATAVAMAASCSLLLKWPEGGPSPAQSADAAMTVALDEIILPRLQLHLQHEGLPQRLRAIHLLGWIAKALAMRQHSRLSKPLETVLAYLEAASLDLATAEEEAGSDSKQDYTAVLDGPGQESSQSNKGDTETNGDAPGGSSENKDETPGQFEDFFDAAEAKAMAQVLARMMAEGSGLTCLNESVHARGRLLWQQKTFLSAWEALEEKLAEGLAFLGKAPAPLLLGLALLSSETPRNIIKNSQASIIPWLLPAVAALNKSVLADDDALRGIIRMLHQALEEATGRMFLEKKAEELITVLLATAEGSKCADIRIAALECLGVVMTLPYNLLHPNVRRVCQNLTKALDDPKRAVRMQAAKTRRLWNPT